MPLPPGQIPVDGMLRSTYIDNQGEIGPVLDYDEVTDVPTFTLDGDVLLITKVPGQPQTTLRFVGSVQRSYQALGLAVRDDTAFVAADFGTVDTNPDDEVKIPIIVGNQYLAIWYAATDREINVIQIQGDSYNYRNEFGAPLPLTIGGVAGFYIISRNTLAAARTGTGILAYNTSGLSTFTRYAATRLQSEGNTFTAADFTGANGVSSTTSVLNAGYRTSTESLHHAYAVPDAEEDISAILWPGFDGGYAIDYITQHERQAGTIEIGGVDCKVWRTTNPFSVLLPLNALIEQVPTL